jgi:phage FluMu protein Com
MRKLAPVRCPNCNGLLCEEVEGVARLRFRCRDCHLRVAVVLSAARVVIVAAK